MSDPSEARIWEMVTYVFWGMMHFGKVSVSLHSAFNKNKHLEWWDTFFRLDLDNRYYTWLDLPSAKMAKPGEIQSVFIVPQGDLYPIKVLQNLSNFVPAGPDDPLFSWRDNQGDICPIVKTTAMVHINTILKAHGWGTAIGHSFCISGASFYLTQKIDPEIIHLAGCWWSLVYEVYIHAFEQIASCHLSDGSESDTRVWFGVTFAATVVVLYG